MLQHCIRKQRKPLDPAVISRYNLVSESDYCAKLFSTRPIRPVANKRIIFRIHALLDQVNKSDIISISISLTAAEFHAEADMLVARECVAQGLETIAKFSASHRRSPHTPTPLAPQPPSMNSMASLSRVGIVTLGCSLRPK